MTSPMWVLNSMCPPDPAKPASRVYWDSLAKMKSAILKLAAIYNQPREVIDKSAYDFLDDRLIWRG